MSQTHPSGRGFLLLGRLPLDRQESIVQLLQRLDSRIPITTRDAQDGVVGQIRAHSDLAGHPLGGGVEPCSDVGNQIGRVHVPRLDVYVSFVKTQTSGAAGYCQRMKPKKPSALILQENLNRLMDEADPPLSQTSLGKLAGIPQKTVGRIKNGEQVPTLTMLDRLAKAFKCQGWQLLIADFRPDRPPRLAIDERQPL